MALLMNTKGLVKGFRPPIYSFAEMAF